MLSLLAVVRERIPARFGLDPVRDVQVLCPMNRGSLGARSLNIELQRVLNPPGPLRVERFGWTFCPGDKVMQVANDYERDVFNGDLGLITAIDAEEGTLTVSFEGRAVEYGFGELDELVLAYATTIHKAQDSEYPVVMIPLATQHYAMLARNLLYTGVTRGRRLVVLVGQRKALAMAVRNTGARRRWSKLREWLGANCSATIRMVLSGDQDGDLAALGVMIVAPDCRWQVGRVRRQAAVSGGACISGEVLGAVLPLRVVAARRR